MKTESKPPLSKKMPNNRSIITDSSIQRKINWINRTQQLSGDFVGDCTRLSNELSQDIRENGPNALLDHLRLSGDIPEQYGHDSSEEKLYSKYTDTVLKECFMFLGLRSFVLTERADAADVEAFGSDYSFVADAKAFRLSRTAKNAKDFKVQAMDGWKRGKPYAMIVCPIYQLPSSSSQIYEQASSRNVCIFTYSHLALLVSFCAIAGTTRLDDLLKVIFRSVNSLNPSKSSQNYWSAVNAAVLGFDDRISEFWRNEKIAATESIAIAKELAIEHLARVRESIVRLSHDEAISALLEMHKIDKKIQVVQNIAGNNILNMGGHQTNA